MGARFLQIHTLTSYPASLLNRDDAGFAKRMPFGGGVRTRISSQCLKAHWRAYDGDHALGSIEAPQSVRSRESFERFIVEPLVKEGVNQEMARIAARKIVGLLLGSEQKKEKADKAERATKARKMKSSEASSTSQDAHEPEVHTSTSDRVATAQVTVLGRPELDYLCQLAREAIQESGDGAAQLEKAINARMGNDKELKANIQALMPGSLEAGLGAALFGRMVTGDILARTDAAIHVAHAMTVHTQMTESDYFSALDDLTRDAGEQASGHINASELTSGVYYGYVVVDVGGLESNLGRDRRLMSDVVHNLVHMVATVSPGAKKGSTAPYAYSHLVLVEAGGAQPRTLQNAFLDAVPPNGSIIESSYQVLAAHLADLDAMYGKNEERAHAGLRTGGLFEQGMSLAGLATWSRDRVA